MMRTATRKSLFSAVVLCALLSVCLAGRSRAADDRRITYRPRHLVQWKQRGVATRDVPWVWASRLIDPLARSGSELGDGTFTAGSSAVRRKVEAFVRLVDVPAAATEIRDPDAPPPKAKLAADLLVHALKVWELARSTDGDLQDSSRDTREAYLKAAIQAFQDVSKRFPRDRFLVAYARLCLALCIYDLDPADVRVTQELRLLCDSFPDQTDQCFVAQFYLAHTLQARSETTDAAQEYQTLLHQFRDYDHWIRYSIASEQLKRLRNRDLN